MKKYLYYPIVATFLSVYLTTHVMAQSGTGYFSDERDIPKKTTNDDHIIVRKVSKEEHGSVAASGGNIYFELNSYKIVTTESIKVWEIARAIKKLDDKIKVIFLEGFASPEGHEDKNFTLANKRALAVKNALIKEGVKEELLQIKTFGDKNNNDFENINKKRRVQLKLYLK